MLQCYDNTIFWPLPSNLSICRQIAGYVRGVRDPTVVGDERGSQANKIIDNKIVDIGHSTCTMPQSAFKINLYIKFHQPFIYY